MSSVPVIDLRDANAHEHVAAACSAVGFFAIVGHGVDPDLLQRSWDAVRAFFDLPFRQRLDSVMPTPGYPYGFSPMGAEVLERSIDEEEHRRVTVANGRAREADGRPTTGDRKQSFAIGPVDPPRHQFVDPDEAFAWSANIWPTAPPELRPLWEARYRAMAELAAHLLGLMARALDLEPDHFALLIDRHTSAMRALDYPGGGPPGSIGASPHTDYGTLTVLEADADEPGLEILRADGTWQGVHPPTGALVVNLGDAMARWTNDRWRSTMHRVVEPARRRQSIAFFHNANWDARIECVPSCMSATEPARYAPVAAGPHLMAKFRSTVNDQRTAGMATRPSM
jgi:isopenicillin N synthase-like dioxygenase